MKNILHKVGFLAVTLMVLFSGVTSVFAQDTTAELTKERHANVQVEQAKQLVQEQTKPVVIDIFERDTCKHCKDLKEFIKKYENDDSVIIQYRNLKDEQTYHNWKTFTEMYNISKITPITIIGNEIIQGFDTELTTGVAIDDSIARAQTKENIFTYDEFVTDKVALSSAGGAQSGCTENSTECAATEANYIFTLPFFGVIDLYDYSLPSISFILGLIDGFNPCAMWVLVTFLLILMQVGDKRRMWEIAGLFILAEGVMYYLILTVWFTAWDFIGLDAIITPIVGIVAIGGGIFFLWEWKNTDGTCQVTDFEQRGKITGKIKKIASSKMNLATVAAIIGLALSVNVIEFACSVGIPQAYTKIIELNMLTAFETHMNMFIYIIAYMIDDFIVFGIALYGIDKLHLATKYSKASNLIGGVLMILLGLILIFARELLVF